jgi:lysophospholipase L1-like esterase
MKLLLTLMMLVAPAGLRAQVIDDMDVNRFLDPEPTKAGDVRGISTAVAGPVGEAVTFAFEDMNRNAFFRREIAADSTWDRSDGFSFLLKGDGSDGVGGLEWIGAGNFERRYAVAFSLRDTSWTRVTALWRDVIPELSRIPFLDTEDFGPGDFGHLMLGKWYYWRDYGPHSFSVDDVRLEGEIEAGAEPALPAGDPLGRVKAKLARGDSVTIVLMGDSLTDYRHWANREVNWPTLLKARLNSASRSAVQIINTAIGGTELNQNLILMPGWVDTVKADLVTVCFGYNDWSSRGRGLQFEASARYAVDRIRRLTGAEVLLMTTAPAVERWTEMEEMAEAIRGTSADRRTGLVDVAAVLHAIGDGDLEARGNLFVRDNVHLGPPGHEAVAEAVARALLEEAE